MKNSIGNLLLVTFLGLLIGAVAGSILDSLLSMNFFGKELLKEAASFQFYIIKIEMQLTPASLIGSVVFAYLVIKRGT
ncbi:MAG: hypothetical protein SFU98_22550 [Leptospiraceae bacterium]|nr:hypothetical protein [Leptospiraceae bacterium]